MDTDGNNDRPESTYMEPEGKTLGTACRPEEVLAKRPVGRTHHHAKKELVDPGGRVLCQHKNAEPAGYESGKKAGKDKNRKENRFRSLLFPFMADTGQPVQDGTRLVRAVKIPTLAGRNGICQI